MPTSPQLRIAFIHPDLGIGGAERLVVDAALGLQALGHSVDIYTSHWNPKHCFEETKDGSLKVSYVKPPFPRSFRGKFHILCAHARQLHLVSHLLKPSTQKYDVYFVDQLSTCIPFLRFIGNTRVVFYCHFPDKLLANGAFVDGNLVQKQGSLIKRIYRYPMDWWEEVTTRQADVLLANSKFTARVFKTYFPSISQVPKIVYPGINIKVYESKVDLTDPDIVSITSQRPTLLSLNRFENKKNAALAIEAFSILKERSPSSDIRLVLAGGYDHRLEDNIQTLIDLLNLAKEKSLSYNIITPKISTVLIPSHIQQSTPDILFLLNFTTAQRTALLNSPSTKVLLYTPTNEHFGIGPVEGMICGIPILACDSGGPTESIIDTDTIKPKTKMTTPSRTGWLRPPNPTIWANVLQQEILSMNYMGRDTLSRRGKERAQSLFSLEAMAKGLEMALVEAKDMGDVEESLMVWSVLKVIVLLLGIVLAYVFMLFFL